MVIIIIIIIVIIINIIVVVIVIVIITIIIIVMMMIIVILVNLLKRLLKPWVQCEIMITYLLRQKTKEHSDSRVKLSQQPPLFFCYY